MGKRALIHSYQQIVPQKLTDCPFLVCSLFFSRSNFAGLINTMLLVAGIDCVDALTAVSGSFLAADLGSYHYPITLSVAFFMVVFFFFPSAMRRKRTIAYSNAMRPLKQTTLCSAFRLPAEAVSRTWLWPFWMRLWGSRSREGTRSLELCRTPWTSAYGEHPPGPD